MKLLGIPWVVTMLGIFHPAGLYWKVLYLLLGQQSSVFPLSAEDSVVLLRQ